jgi:phospholipid transport system transporter-binding protein
LIVPQATLTNTGADKFAVSGELSFATVTGLLAQSRSLFAVAANLDIDLSGVKHADSAGLSLLLEWLRYGKRESKAVRYHGLPAQLHALANISEVDSLFGNVA